MGYGIEMCDVPLYRIFVVRYPVDAITLAKTKYTELCFFPDWSS